MRIAPKELLAQRGQLDKDVVAVIVDGKIVDLHTPIDPPAKMDVLRQDNPKALEIIRHSTAHVMADAVQKLFPGTQVTIGPAIDNGFFYDFSRPDHKPFTDADLAQIEVKMGEIIAGSHDFRREVISREQAKAMFASMGETFKLEIIDAIPEGEDISLYRHGDWVDVCRGPHVPNTRFLQGVKLTSVAGAYWRGQESNPMLQRIYGTAFPSKKALDAYLKQLEEAKARDHRKLGKELDLFMMSDLAPASPFFLPRGAFVYNTLIDFVRKQYARRGYREVITPQIFDKALWERSGHWANYRENMFMAFGADALEEVPEGRSARGTPMAEVFVSANDKAKEKLQGAHLDYVCGCKAMNCPSHCVMFGAQRRSYRELPLRIADFGRLHRYERSGVTHGLTRVRTFSQDDGHIFCTPEQMQDEIAKFMDFFYDVYRALAFDKIEIRLATRPEKRLGTDAMWDQAEAALAKGLEARNLPYVISEGEGAFYGPKLEFHITDAIGRPWQLGTIQVDYNLPERFELEYIGADNTAHRPVMLHRAILGSIERFLGVYIEHVAGAFPVWLAPEQLALLTVADRHNDFAHQVRAELEAKGLRVVVDDSNEKLGGKIRNARNLRIPYLGVIGDKEVEARALALRSRTEGELGSIALDTVIERLLKESAYPLS
ncbi:MAG: threonine--tRNA ligase [Polyangiales bacterium]